VWGGFRSGPNAPPFHKTARWRSAFQAPLAPTLPRRPARSSAWSTPRQSLEQGGADRQSVKHQAQNARAPLPPPRWPTTQRGHAQVIIDHEVDNFATDRLFNQARPSRRPAAPPPRLPYRPVVLPSCRCVALRRAAAA